MAAPASEAGSSRSSGPASSPRALRELARATGAHGLRCPARTPGGEALAGWWKRFAARLIDWIIVWLGSLPLTHGYFIYRAGNELGPAFDRYVRQIEQGNTGATPPTVTPDVLKWVVAYSVILTLVAIAYEVFFDAQRRRHPRQARARAEDPMRERPEPLTFQTALTRTIIPMGGSLLFEPAAPWHLVAMVQAR